MDENSQGGYQQVEVFQLETLESRDQTSLGWKQRTTKISAFIVVPLLFSLSVFYVTVRKDSGSKTIVFSDLGEMEKQSLFSDFKEKYQIKYSSKDEENIRFSIFKSNLQNIDAWNNDPSNTGKTQYGITKFADWSEDESVSFLKSAIKPEIVRTIKKSSNTDVEENQVGEQSLTGSSDWRDKFITPIKDQGTKCNSCWAHVITEQVESDAIRTGVSGFTTSTPLSPQHLISCYAASCDVQSTKLALEWIVQSRGLIQESSFPYAQTSTATVPACKTTDSQYVVTVNPSPFFTTTAATNPMYYAAYSFQSEYEMGSYVLSTGPITANMYADQKFNVYKSGLVTCSSVDDVNHSVQLVGLKIPSGDSPANSYKNSYWIARNSWGTDWGTSGFFYLPFGVNMCNIALNDNGNAAFYVDPVAKNGGIQKSINSVTTNKPTSKPTTKPSTKKPAASPSPKPIAAPPSKKPTALPSSSKPTRKPSSTKKPTKRPVV